MFYLILVLLGVLIVLALYVLRMTRKRLEEMDGLGKVLEPGEDQEDEVIGSFGDQSDNMNGRIEIE